MKKKGRRIFFIIISIAVISAAFLYINQKPHAQISLVDSKKTNSDLIFPAPDKTLYQMQVYLDVSTRTLYGTTLLTTQNTSAQTLDELWFTTYPNCFRNSNDTPAPAEAYYAGFNPGWLKFDSFKVNGADAQIIEKGACIQVKITKKIAPGEAIKIEMSWQEKIPRLKYRFGNKDTVYMLGNFYPALNVLSKNGWHNSYNSVFGDPFCFQSANYVVSISLPEDYQMVSSGNTVSRQSNDDGRETYLIQAQNARDFSLLVMYDYTEIKVKAPGTTIKCYIPAKPVREQTTRPSDVSSGTQKELGQKIIKQAERMLNYYSCQFGSYPYAEFKVVFVPMQGFHGMEYSGLIYLREEFLEPDYDQAKRDFFLAHEIAHQWWYGMVGNDQLREPWLDEGLASWSAYKYLADVEGKKNLVQVQVKPGLDLGKELRDMYSTQEYYLTAYSGGESFWFGLEEELGSEVVIKVLRRYLADYKNKIASTQDLMKIIKIEAHRNMDEYIRQWFPTGAK